MTNFISRVIRLITLTTGLGSATCSAPSSSPPISSAAGSSSGGVGAGGSAGGSNTSVGTSAGTSSGASGAADAAGSGGSAESAGGALSAGMSGATGGQSFGGAAGANADGSTSGGAAGTSAGGASAEGGPWRFPSGVIKPRIMIVGDSISAGPGCYKKYLLQQLTDNHFSKFEFVGEYSDDCGGVVRHSAVSCSTAAQYTQATFTLPNCSAGTTFKGLSGLMTSQ